MVKTTLKTAYEKIKSPGYWVPAIVWVLMVIGLNLMCHHP